MELSDLMFLRALDSDKEGPNIGPNISRNTEVAIVTTTPSLGVWQKVHKKKDKRKNQFIWLNVFFNFL